MPRQWRELEPGVYASDDGELRIIMPEILVAAGYPPTAANMRKLADAAALLVQREHPQTRLIVTRDPAPI